MSPGRPPRPDPDPQVVVEPAESRLGDLVGLGGYVIGRTAEKILPGLVDSLKKG